MTCPNPKPCPVCGHPVTVYTYESGWRRAECDCCDYIAEPAQNRLQATRNHNTRCTAPPPTTGDAVMADQTPHQSPDTGSSSREGPTVTTSSSDEWAIVELMGHRIRTGRISEIEKFGAKFLQVDLIAGDGFVSEIYGGSSIYAIRPISEEIARERAAASGDPRPVSPLTYRLAAPAPEVDEEDDDWSTDGGEERR